MQIKIGLALAVLVGGCADAAKAPVLVVADTFCQSAKKRTWHVDDTLDTISEAIRQNAGIDRACGVPKSTKVAAK